MVVVFSFVKLYYDLFSRVLSSATDLKMKTMTVVNYLLLLHVCVLYCTSGIDEYWYFVPNINVAELQYILI